MNQNYWKAVLDKTKRSLKRTYLKFKSSNVVDSQSSSKSILITSIFGNSGKYKLLLYFFVGFTFVFLSLAS